MNNYIIAYYAVEHHVWVESSGTATPTKLKAIGHVINSLFFNVDSNITYSCELSDVEGSATISDAPFEISVQNLKVG